MVSHSPGMGGEGGTITLIDHLSALAITVVSVHKLKTIEFWDVKKGIYSQKDTTGI